MNASLMAAYGLQTIVDAPVWVMLLLKATAVLLAAWAAHLALWRVNPRWRVLLWRITAVGLVVLPAVGWLLPALEILIEPPPAEEMAAASPPSTILLNDGSRLSRSEALLRNGLPGSSASQHAKQSFAEVGPQAELGNQGEGESHDYQDYLSGWPEAIFAVWLAGIAVLVLRWSIGHYRIGQMMRYAQQPQSRIRSECLRVAQAVGCKKCVDVMQSAIVQSPLLCRLRRPVLVLPPRMCDDSYRDALPAIFAHELTHVRFRDLLWNAALHLISIVLWFHPLAWRMRRAHLAACELVCDAVSANFMGNVNDYCRTLARIAVESVALPSPAGIAMARTSNVSRRLSALKTKVFHLPLRRRNVVGFGLAAILTVAILGILHFGPAVPSSAGLAAAASEARPQREKEKAAVPKDADRTPTTGSLRVQAFDLQGKPLAGVNVHASVWTEEKGFKANREYQTDAKGQTAVELPKTFNILRLFVTKRGHVPLFQGWEENWFAAGNRLPEQFTFRLRKGTIVGGVVKNDEGRPIPGAKVEVSCAGGDCLTWLATGDDARVTDAQGRWTLDNVPEGDKIQLSLRLNHPDYISDRFWGGLQKEQDVALPSLRAQKATIVMHRGIVVTGSVTDAAGRPVAEAVVAWGDDPYRESSGVVGRHEVRTDALGIYRLPALPPEPTTVTVMAQGFSPDLRKITVTRENPKVDFQLKTGKTVRIRFVDASGKPIPEVEVQIEAWRGGKSLYNIKHPQVLDTKIPDKADKSGVWEWTWAPDDPVKLHCYSYPLKGFAPCDLEIAGGAPPRTVTLKAEHRITGRVTDAVTGKPIPAFTIIPVDVFGKDWLHAERMNAVVGKDGRLEYLAERLDIPLRLRVEASGYRIQTGPQFRVGDATPRTQDFPLQPSPPVSGVVLAAAGRPVEKAEVFLATPTEVVELGPNAWLSHRVLTDAGGRFVFPDPGEPFAVVAQADAGFALAEFPADRHDVGALRLEPWASVRGQFRDGGQPIRGAMILLGLVRLDNLDRPKIESQVHAVTSADGRFELPRVPPVPVSVRVHLWLLKDEGFRSGPSVPLEPKPGQHVELDLGGAGAVVKGKVTLTGKVPPDLDCAYSRTYLIRRAPGIAAPPAIAKAGFDVRNGWQATWQKTQEGLAYLSTLQHWSVKLSPDGAFRVSGVPPGEYDLAIEIYARSSGCLIDPVAQKVVRVAVTSADAARGELTLPEIPATVVPIPAVGDTPSLAFERPDGTAGSLKDFRGRSTIVHFWASWCGPCQQHFPALRRLRERAATHGTAMLGLSLDDDRAAWQGALKRLDLPWPQGRLPAARDAGLSSVPAYWLLDAAGKIVAKGYDPDELMAAAGNPAPKPRKE